MSKSAISSGTAYTVTRVTDKAYLTGAGGFSPDIHKAERFTSFSLAAQAVSQLRVITRVAISRLDLSGYAS